MTSTSLPAPRSRGRTVVIAALIAAAVAAMAIPGVRASLLQLLRISTTTSPGKEGDKTAGHGHDEHGHEHVGEPTDHLTLSEQAQRNIGLQLAQVQLQTFERTISIPGIVVERPGRSTIEVTAPLTGVVTRIYPIRGQAVSPGEPLFELRLTHEDLVLAQRDFLRTAEELDVIDREIARLQRLTTDGAIAAKTVLERQYEQQKNKAALRAQHQALLLHGLSEQQVVGILETRSLLQFMTVAVPQEAEQSRSGKAPMYQVEELKVERGQYFNAGDTLAVLTDHAELFIEGNAFEKDLADVNRAVDEGRPVAAVLESEGSKPQTIAGLKLLYLAGRVDPDSRAFHFYVMLPNALLRDKKTDDGHRFVTWRFKPGQRMKRQIPVEQWAQRIVLPIDAIAQDGVETYVFQPSGKQFIRRPVHVEYRDPFWAVIANDGALFPGDQVATTGAQQMQLALKNKAGGGIDPHAGHNH